MEIGFIILGAAGEIGSRVVRSIGNMLGDLDGCGEPIVPHILSVVDPKFRHGEQTNSFYHGTLLKCPPSVHIDPKVEIFSEPDIKLPCESAQDHFLTYPVVVYDASPPEAHQGYFAEFMELQNQMKIPRSWQYVSEKPLFLDRKSIAKAENLDSEYQFYCDFIETVNPVFEQALQRIVATKSELKHLWFWRAGSIGIEKALEYTNREVSGGAWYDKSIHDLGLAYNFVRTQIEHPTLSLIGQPTALAGIPYPGKPNEFLTVEEDHINRFAVETHYSSIYIADAATSASVLFKNSFGDTRVVATFLSSWVGLLTDTYSVQEQYIQKIQSLGLSLENFLQVREEKNYIDQEVRLAILESEHETLICNFLAKPGGNVHRFLFVKPNDGEGFYIIKPLRYDTTHDHRKQLVRLINIINSKQSSESLIGRLVTTEAHKILLQAKEESMKHLAKTNFDAFYAESKQLIQKKTKPRSTL